MHCLEVMFNSLDAKLVLYFWDISINPCQLKPIHWLIHGGKSTRYFVKSWKIVFQSYKFLKTWHRPHLRPKFQILPKPGFGQRHILYVPMAVKELSRFSYLLLPTDYLCIALLPQLSVTGSRLCSLANNSHESSRSPWWIYTLYTDSRQRGPLRLHTARGEKNTTPGINRHVGKHASFVQSAPSCAVSSLPFPLQVSGLARQISPPWCRSYRASRQQQLRQILFFLRVGSTTQGVVALFKYYLDSREFVCWHCIQNSCCYSSPGEFPCLLRACIYLLATHSDLSAW